MRARVEGDLLVVAERLVDEDVEVVEVAEGRHGAGLALGELRAEVALGGELETTGVRGLLQPLHVDAPRGGQHDHGQLPVELDHHRLGQLLAGDVRRGGDLLCGVCRRVLDHLVFHVFCVQIGYQLVLSYFKIKIFASGYNILDNAGYRFYNLKKRFLQIGIGIKY